MVQVGELISERQKELLMQFISTGEVADIANATKVGHSLLLKVRGRQTPISPKSEIGFNVMVSTALENVKKSTAYNLEAENDLTEMLKK